MEESTSKNALSSETQSWGMFHFKKISEVTSDISIEDRYTLVFEIQWSKLYWSKGSWYEPLWGDHSYSVKGKIDKSVFGHLAEGSQDFLRLFVWVDLSNFLLLVCEKCTAIWIF